MAKKKTTALRPPKYVCINGRGERRYFHSYDFKSGTIVELGADSGYFCRYCGKEWIRG